SRQNGMRKCDGVQLLAFGETKHYKTPRTSSSFHLLPFPGKISLLRTFLCTTILGTTEKLAILPLWMSQAIATSIERENAKGGWRRCTRRRRAPVRERA